MDHLADRTRRCRLNLEVDLIATFLAAILVFLLATRSLDFWAPTPFVTVSAGTTITANANTKFDATSMPNACRQKADGDALSILNYHDLIRGGLGEGTAVLAHIYEMTRQQRYVAELYELITLALSLSGVQVIHQVSHSEGRSP
jgi:hypothetical protein